MRKFAVSGLREQSQLFIKVTPEALVVSLPARPGDPPLAEIYRMQRGRAARGLFRIEVCSLVKLDSATLTLGINVQLEGYGGSGGTYN